MSEQKETKKDGHIIGGVEVFFFTGLLLSTYGVYLLQGLGWACFWCGLILIAVAYRAPS